MGCSSKREERVEEASRWKRDGVGKVIIEKGGGEGCYY